MQSDQQVNFFRDVTNLIDSVADVDRLLEILLITATNVMRAKASSLLLVDKKTDRLYFHIAVGEGKEDIKQFELKKGEGIAGWVAEHNEPVVVSDVATDPRWSSKISQSIGFKTSSIVCAPLRVGDEVIGVLEIIDREDGKPFRQEDLDQLQAFSEMASTALHRARAFREVNKKNLELLNELDYTRKILGESSVIKKAINDCYKVADSKATTLILGESGTGKELFAKLIHNASKRKNKPMVVVNCGALPETLLERELFGHEKGAFTGADSLKPGLFESADTGSIFLDEIGETTPAMQVKLLRVLQDGSFFRVGGQKLIEVDVRVIAATNKNLETLVEQKIFREDLFYRLNVIQIKLPPLRERREDIRILTEEFLKKISRKINPGIKSISPEAMTIIANYSWPGNIRQLENAIERAVIMSESDRIRPEDLPPEITEYKTDDIQAGATLKEAQDNFKKTFILKSLNFSGGNKTKTAKTLGIQRTYLSRLIKELNINA